MRYIACLLAILSLSGCISSVYEVPVVGNVVAGQGDTRPFEQPLPINTQPKRLALGSDFAIGVKEDGTVWSWGYGMLGLGKFESRDVPQAIPNMTDFIEVVAGSEHVLALRKDGTVWSWGDNEKGALGYKEDGVPYGSPNDIRFSPHQLTPKQIPELKDIVSIAAGSRYSLALDKEGRVWGWGSEFKASKTKTLTPEIVFQAENAVKVVSHDMSQSFGILTKTGQVKLWQTNKLTEVLFERPVVDFVIGPVSFNMYFLLDTGRVYAVGDNRRGELGCCRLKSKTTEPVLIPQLGHIVKISTYSALDDKGRVWQWGREAGVARDYVYFSASNIYTQFYPRVMLNGKKIVDMYCCTAAFAEDGSVWFWGNDLGGRRGDAKPIKSSYEEKTHKYWTTPIRSLWMWK
ncbi:MAG TPA: hypothetical protein PKN43_04810 [Agitococcus sp.]|nr:hypothetical protein [Agitococcus sp.]HNP02088.1 hypothetical protein [Agitococcus sp.]